jgi:subtilisin family serine protease
MMRAMTRVRFSRRALAGTLLASVGLVLWPIRVRAPEPDAAGEPQPTYAVWLYLDSAAARSDAPPALGPAALARRRAQGIPLRDVDRPIAPRLVQLIRQTGARVRVESRWLRAVSVEATVPQLHALQRLPFVRRIQPVGRLQAAVGPRLSGAMAAGQSSGRTGLLVEAPEPDSASYGVNYRAMAVMGIPQVHELGLSGQGVGIAILDTGFERQHEALRGRIVGGQYDFINSDTVVANQPGEAAAGDQERHGTSVWSLIGGLTDGLIKGPAYNATFFLAKVDSVARFDFEPGDTGGDEDRWVDAAEWAEEMGAKIISSSVFFRSDFSDRPPIPFQELNGNVTATSIAAKQAARSGILVVQAIGNALRADGSLAAPADADSILAVGAVDLNGEPVDLGVTSSARGPTSDARRKPEVVAVGVNLAAANSVNEVGLTYGLSGTSYSTAIMAGAAALFMEAWPELSAQAVRRAFLLAGDHAESSNNLVGWGLPNLGAAIMFPEGLATSSISTATLAPVFNWSGLLYDKLRPITFTLRLATDSLIEQVVATDSTRDALSLTLRAPLRPGSVLWWRVTARSPNGITRRSDTGGPFTVPDWVTQITLAGDQETFTETTRPEFAWVPLPAPPPIGPLTYDVEVLANGTLEVVQFQRNLTDTRTTMPLPLTANVAYRWRVIAHTQGGQVDTVTSANPFVVNSSEDPPATVLFQNFPNPFPTDLGLTSTRIWFNLAASSIVELTVHDLRGRLVRTLIPARPSCSIQLLPAGLYGRPGSPVDGDDCILTTWDGRDQQGERLPRGIYVLRLLANGKPEYRRMLYQPN